MALPYLPLPYGFTGSKCPPTTAPHRGGHVVACAGRCGTRCYWVDCQPSGEPAREPEVDRARQSATVLAPGRHGRAAPVMLFENRVRFGDPAGPGDQCVFHEVVSPAWICSTDRIYGAHLFLRSQVHCNPSPFNALSEERVQSARRSTDTCGNSVPAGHGAAARPPIVRPARLRTGRSGRPRNA